MKKLILIASVLMGAQFSQAQSTATNFNCNDCAGGNHDLFTELNSGKVIVIAWVMPCGSCIGPSLSAYNEVQNYTGSNPGQVLFYCADDYANTSCTSLTTWCNTNGMPDAKVFSDVAVNMSDYGSAGMPKVVVLGGANHTVFFNQNNGLNVTNFNNAVNQAIAASSVGVKENSVDNFHLSLFPNPLTNKKALLNYYLKNNDVVNIEVYNALGAKVATVLNAQKPAGKQEQQIDLSTFPAGVYFIKLLIGDETDMLKFVISE